MVRFVENIVDNFEIKTLLKLQMVNYKNFYRWIKGCAANSLLTF